MKCLRKVNGSKIKSKMPIECFLAQRDSENGSDSFAIDALDLPLPPPTVADFPELPRAAPAPKMTKAEKAMANKIIASLSLTTIIPPHFRHFRPPLPSVIHPFLVPTTLSSVLPVEPWLQAITGRLCGVNRPPHRQNLLPGLLRPRRLSPPWPPLLSPRSPKTVRSPLRCRHRLPALARAQPLLKTSGMTTPTSAGL